MRTIRPATSLSLFSAISLLLAGILFCGYFAILGPTLIVIRTVPIARVDSYSLELDKGRIRFWAENGTPAPGMLAGHRFRWSARPELPDLKRCFWEFDNHSLSPILPGAHIIAFPIWCPLLPCLIAPLMWLRKRRHQSPIGFAVITESR